MSKIIISLLAFLWINTPLLKLNNNNNYHFEEWEDTEVYNQTDFNKTSNNDEIKIIALSKDLLIVIMKDFLIIDNRITKLTIKGTYQNYFLNNQDLYLIMSEQDTSILYEINDQRIIKKIELNFFTTDLVYYNNYLYLIGQKDNNPLMEIRTLNGDIIKTKIWESDGYCCFTHIEILGNHFMVGGKKDAHLFSPYFSSVGNKGDKKSMLLIIDETLDISQKYYFNENQLEETILDFKIINNELKVILSTTEDQYLYIFNNKGNLINRTILPKYNEIAIIPTILFSNLIIGSDNKNNELFDINKNEIIYSINDEIIGINVIDGLLYIYTKDKNQIIKQKIYTEYHIEYLNPLIVNKLSYDIKSQNHFKVSSYFEKLNFDKSSISPYHEYTVSGNYEITYVATNAYEMPVEIKTPLIVQDYINIIDGGVYPVNTTLSFFGKGYINNQLINQGYPLTEVGEYDLIIEDANKKQRVYHFIVVDDYYKENDHMVMPSDFIVQKHESIKLEIELNQELTISSIIVNQNPLTSFIQEGNHLTITIPGSDESGYRLIKISALEYEQNGIKKQYQINKEYVVLTLKEKPTLLLNVLSKDNKYEFDFSIEDFDNSIVDIVFYEEQNIHHTFLKNNDLHLSSINNGEIKGYVLYELGDGVIIKDEIMTYLGSIEENSQFIKMIVTSNPLGLSKTMMILDLNNPKLECTSLQVKEKNILNPTNVNNLPIYLITGIGSLLLLIIFGLLIIIKIKKRMKKISL